MRLALLYMAGAAALWATMDGLATLLDSNQGAIDVVWMRYATHLAILMILFGPRRKAAIVQTVRPRLQIARGLLMLLMPLCFLAAIHATEPENVLSIFWISPILAMVFGIWLLRERVASRTWLIASGGWLGAVLLTRPAGFGNVLGIIPAFGMAGCLSLYLVMTRILRDESTLSNLFYTAACVLIPLSLIVPFFWNRPSPRDVAIMMAIGLIGLGALFGFDRATDLAPVSVVAPMLYIQPVCAYGIQLAFGDAHPGKAATLGTVLILAICTTIFAAIRRRNSSVATDGTVHTDQPVRVQL
jgi:drug/metabolite transporter (DMT)-like permease